MASPQFLTPRPVTPSHTVKRFTLAEARRTLPLVRRVVSDVVRTHERIANEQAALAAAKPKDQQGLQKDLDRSMERLTNYVDELHSIGCEVKDFQTGLIDFIGCHRGHDVCLCWKLGEETISYWHEVQAGFAGRQPVSVLEEN
jgi:hypothetical protein